MSDQTPTSGLTVLLLGASGMVGQGVLRECLRDDRVAQVRAVVRRPLTLTHPKLQQILTEDVTAAGDHLTGVDATFDAIGVSAAGLSDADYRRLTYDLTLDIARAIAQASPGSAFVYVSGAGTSRDSRATWAKVKAETEDALAALPLRTWFFRPALIQPLHGIRPTVRSYRLMYAALRPVLPLLIRLAPGQATTTEAVGQAMITAATGGIPGGPVDTRQINTAA